MMFPVKSPKKLIEVALPLDAINEAAAKEKSIRHGHPSTMHLWWAPRPLAAARAVIFSQMVNDPSWKWELEHHGQIPPANLKASWAASRKRLFEIIKELVQWDATTDENILKKARKEIIRSWHEVCALNGDHPKAKEIFNPEVLPNFHDPFSGGGAIPLEAQRLGLVANATDLNPVAVLINKSKIEIPPKFLGRNPVGHSEIDLNGQLDIKKEWAGNSGLAEDVRRYAAWMRKEAIRRIGNLYPLLKITPEVAKGRPDLQGIIGQEVTIIAWLWARTVRSSNPAFSDVEIPLVSSFVLCSIEGQEVYVKPIIHGAQYEFQVIYGVPPKSAEEGTKVAGKGSSFRCLLSGAAISGAHIKAEGKAGRMGQRLLAVVAESSVGRIYFSPQHDMELVAKRAVPEWKPELELVGKSADQMPLYGMSQYWQLFTARQLVALSTLSELVGEARGQIIRDATAAGLEIGESLESGGTGAQAYADAISIYLAFCVDKNTLTNTTLATWQKDPARLTQAFSRQAIAMTWDFVEANPLSGAGGGFGITADAISKVLLRLPISCPAGSVLQQNAEDNSFENCLISTDPPYYDNIMYADLSDYFYVWLRKSLKGVVPKLLATMATPKKEELVASPFRHDSDQLAEVFFMNGMKKAMRRLVIQSHPAFPVTIYYAFKQSDTRGISTSSTGWESFLEAVVQSGFSIVGTWPMRTELTGNLKKKINALASSIVLVCRKRPEDAGVVSRRDFLRELNASLPQALDEMTKGAGSDRSPVRPSDLSQAIIGPGMAVYSQYSDVIESDGSRMPVKTALQLINRFLAGDDLDENSQFCLQWFESYGWNEGGFGEADNIARSKGTSVAGIDEAGVVVSGSGKVRLRKWLDYPTDWEPLKDKLCPVWKTIHHLIRAMKNDGETAAAQIMANTIRQAESVRQLAYRLYTLCERKDWAEDARVYNELITSWGAIETTASRVVIPGQGDLFGDGK